MRRLLPVAVAAVALAVPAAGSAHSVATTYAFGRAGGNILPFRVAIAADGAVTVTGPVQPAKTHVTARDLARVATLVRTQRFLSLSRSTSCAGTLPDFAALYVTVRSHEGSRTVRVRGSCSPRFSKVYAALAQAVGMRA